jgi:hypothetical protein
MRVTAASIIAFTDLWFSAFEREKNYIPLHREFSGPIIDEGYMRARGICHQIRAIPCKDFVYG